MWREQREKAEWICNEQGFAFIHKLYLKPTCVDVKDGDQKSTMGRIGDYSAHPDVLALWKRNLVNLYLQREKGFPLHYISV